jgi:NAD(P)-dependent dehydrogenase (short-subunit alcohol dehydrogenase family)
MFVDGLFAGKKILVTGGGTGLGRAMAERFLGLGAEIAICGRRKAVCDASAEELMRAHGGRVSSYGVDIRDAAAVEAMVEEIFRDGPLTGLVNNAAGNFISRTEDLSCTAPSMSRRPSASAGSQPSRRAAWSRSR